MATTLAATDDGATRSVHYARGWLQRKRWLKELAELLALPTLAAIPSHRPDLQAAARWLAAHMHQLGLDGARVLPGSDASAPSVYADWLHAPGRPTLLLYGHFDVQPVGPLAEWRTGPFVATVRGANLYARGASDDKGQLFIHLKALESYLATQGRLPLNVKVWLEGEEEIGSPNLDAFLDRELDRLRADAILVSDTEMPCPGHPSIIYGLRGAVTMDLDVCGPRGDLHAGRYGGAVLNPVEALCRLVAGLHDARGRIAVQGVYDRVRLLGPTERQELRCQAVPDRRLLDQAGVSVGSGEAGYSAFERTTIRPALSVTGIAGGSTDIAAKAAIPSRAVARLSMRLVPDQEPAEIGRLLGRHLAASTPAGVRLRARLAGGSRPVLIPRRHPVMAAAARAVYQSWGVPPLFTRSGGSIPAVEQLHRRLGAPAVLLGFGLPDDRVHAANEKLSLPQLFRGVETVVRLLAEYAA